MRDPFVFDSRSEFCKKPFGAVPCGSECHVSCPSPAPGMAIPAVSCVARREFSGEEIQMELLPEAVDGERTRFTGILTAPTEPELLWYHFRLIRSDGSTALLDQSGWQETGGRSQSWQLTVYEKTATPSAGCGGGVVYQIFPDRFCRLSLPDPTGLVGNRWVHENWTRPARLGGRTQTARYETGTFSAALSMASPPSLPMIWPLWASPCCT